MNIQELIQRFEFYATSNEDLNHVAEDKKKQAFANCDMEDVQAIIKNGCTFPVLLFQTPVIDKDGDYDSKIEHFECSFIVLMPLPKGDFRGKPAIVQQCKNIADDIYNIFSAEAEENIEGGLVKTAEGVLGPMVDQLYGWGVNFGFDQPYQATVNPAKWRHLQ